VGLRIVEEAGITDVGRQRQTNEDAFIRSSPIYAVADGMGGARAGEVASRIAVEAFEDERDPEASPEAQLADIVRTANRRIYELAQQDESRRGMGTTLTAAMVTGHEVSIGHVGDSRAYRLRGDRLEQLTRDHSLVGELERRGELTPEEAEQHPQKSIITRALGPEPDVDVDTYTDTGRDGDVYLLCSDGLTGMVAEGELADIIRQAPSLKQAADQLVRTANQSGGRDNITVVLFRLGADAAEGADEDTLSGRETVAGGLSVDEVNAAAAAQTTATRSPQAPASAPHPRSPPPRRRAAEVAPRRRRRLARAVVALVLLVGVAAGLYAGGRQLYFVGTDDSGLVTLYRGVPYELPLGVELYSTEFVSSVPARTLPRRRRERVLDHELRSRDDAADLVRQLERDRSTP
jgi:serine/threonine protein phosphatase PrpC